MEVSEDDWTQEEFRTVERAVAIVDALQKPTYVFRMAMADARAGSAKRALTAAQEIVQFVDGSLANS